MPGTRQHRLVTSHFGGALHECENLRPRTDGDAVVGKVSVFGEMIRVVHRPPRPFIHCLPVTSDISASLVIGSLLGWLVVKIGVEFADGYGICSVNPASNLAIFSIDH